MSDASAPAAGLVAVRLGASARGLSSDAADPAPGVKLCPGCGQSKPLTEFYLARGKGGVGTRPMARCKPCSNARGKARHRERWAADPAYRARMAATTRRCTLRRLYGLTEAEFEARLAAQGGACAVCGGVQPSGRRLVVDFDRRGRRVRDLLCTRCDTLVGVVESEADRLAACAAYVTRHAGQVALG